MAAVVENSEPMLLLGQDVLGGARSKLRTVALNTDYAYYTVVDESTGSIANIHYLKNVEISALPTPMGGTVNVVLPESSVAALFRR